MVISFGPYTGQRAIDLPSSVLLREILPTLPLGSDLGQHIRWILLERIDLFQPKTA